MSYVDSREVPDGSELDTDTCIIGGRAAGITMAAELIGSSRRVILLESGGLTLDAETQALYNGDNIGFPYYPPATLRLRFLGGTTNHWAGACKPLDAIDFQQRDWVPFSGWPIDRDELEPYYHRAHEVCDLGPMDYDPCRWQGPDAQPIDVDQEWLQTRMYQVSPPTRFATKYGPVLEQQSNVSTYLHGNTMRLEPDESGEAIRSVTVACLTGTQFRIRAGKFILAMGALENVRFLLHCMESESLLPGSPKDNNGFGVLTPSPRAMEREGMLQANVNFSPTSLREGIRSVAPGLIGASVAAQSGQLFDDLGQHVRNIMLELDDLLVYPADGVVNGDCLMHGAENVYIAGSSVFASSGAAIGRAYLRSRTDESLERELVSTLWPSSSRVKAHRAICRDELRSRVAEARLCALVARPALALLSD